jgi:CHASE2 domain-containing sensor protein
MKVDWIFIAQIAGLITMQSGLAAAGVMLTRWEWWVTVIGALVYAIATGRYAVEQRTGRMQEGK